MAPVVILLFVFLTLDQLTSLLAADEYSERTTLDEYFPKYDKQYFYSRVRTPVNSSDEIYFENTPLWHLRYEVYNYSKTVQLKVKSEFLSELSKVTLLSVSQDLKRHCGEDLKNTIEDFHVTPRYLTCVKSRLTEILMSKLKRAVAATVDKFSSECGRQQQQQPACNCAVDFDRRSAKLLGDFVHDKAAVRSLEEFFTTPLEIVQQILNSSLEDMLFFESVIPEYFELLGDVLASLPSVEPFTYENFIHPGFIQSLLAKETLYNSITQTQEDLTWGIIKSFLGNVDHPCDHYKELQLNDSLKHRSLVDVCFFISILRLHLQLARCVIEDRKLSLSPTAPLRWSAVPSAYLNSQCLCVAYNGTDCGVLEEPRGLYCLSVLMKDFRRQISYRPAVTYRDYAFMTRVSLCQFARLVTVGFNSDCSDGYWVFRGPFLIQSAQSAQCYFDGLVDRKLSCPEIRDLNATFLCGLRVFVMLVVCDEGDFNSSVPFYEAGDSALVEVLSSVDVSVRMLTLVTYLSCPQLRNLPGKLLIGYQTTALLRLLLVVKRLKDLALAVRLDVTSDLSSTLWLTSYLHFLTSSIKTLRLPDSLSPDEVLAVLLRYSLLGWAAPAALSSLCFWMDDAVDSRVQFGQLLLVLCSYAALVWNIFMFYQNLNFYHDVKSNAASIKKNVKVRSVFADLFEFAVKTSVLSGAGITFRLIFTQIQGLEHVLSYYHAMGTLQGLLLFVLYGCNREARAFWRRTLSAKALRSCRRRENNPT